MATTDLKIVVDPLKIQRIAAFIVAVQEIAGTTNDPNTATNLHAAINALYGRKL